MRISDICDSVAIDQIEGNPLLLSDLSQEELGELGELGKSLWKKVRKASNPFRMAKEYDPLTKAAIKYDPAARYLNKRVFTKKWFLANAKYLSLAAQVLNFIVPGLGVLVSFAISASALALSLVEAKKAKAMAAKAEKASDAEIAAAQVDADKDANKALDEAYVKGGLYFTTAYGMTNDNWSALSVEGKNKFLNVVLYDQHAPAMQKMGVTREAFQAMSAGEEQEALAKMAQNLPGSPGPYVENSDDAVNIPVNAQGQALGPVPTVAAFMGGGPWYTDPLILGGGALIVAVAAVVIWKLKRIA